MSRIFKQFGRGYGSSPVNIVAQIDGTTVYSGPVPTLDQTVPGSWTAGQDPNLECFSWTEPTSNAQTRSMTITVTVTGGILNLGPTLAQSNSANAEQYGQIYMATIADETFGDPLSEVTIDGSLQSRAVDELPGQWNWQIDSGSTLTATITSNIFPTGNA